MRSVVLRVEHRRTLLGLALGVIAVSLATGFWLDWRGFAGNSLAGLADMVAGFLIAIVLVDRYTKAERNARWASVAEATTRTLESAAVRAALPAFVQLSAPRAPAFDPQMALTLGRLPHALSALADALREAGQEPFARAFDSRAFLDAVLPSTHVITNIVLPRLLSLDVDPELVRPIVELESVVAQLDYHAWMGTTMQIPASTVYRDAADLIGALAVVVRAHDH